MKNKSSRLRFVTAWPSPKKFGDDVLLIYDSIFEKQKVAQNWIHKFPVRYGVKSGETLKDLERFSWHMDQVLRLTQNLSSRKLKIVVLGGGSVGDFGGFVASVYKRGVELIHIPSTWLAAMDSAHGGKTALNVGRAKNQVGTFYPASEIYLIKPLLVNQPEERNFEALGELIKMALLSGGTLFRQLTQVKNLKASTLWTLLPLVIREKNKIVAQDPQEKSGVRHLLNLGHTLGHVFEAHYGLPHGVAVLAGVQFALEWSFQRGLLSDKEYEKIALAAFWKKAAEVRKQSSWNSLRMASLLSEKPQIYKQYLQHDKKKSSAQKIRFIFIRKPGVPVIQEVDLQEFIPEIRRQCEFWG